MPYNHLILCHLFLFLLSILFSITVFSSEAAFTSGGQSMELQHQSLPVNIQIWFPLGLTSLFSLQPMGLSRVFHSTTLWKHQFLGAHGEGNGNPLQYSCLENPMDRGTYYATVHGVAKSRTRMSDFTFFFSFLYRQTLTTVHDYWKNHSFDNRDNRWQNDIFAF